MTRHVFFSFHYQPDNWRASQIRNIGVVDGNKPAHDNDWETVKRGGDAAIETWIREQMKGRSCALVLVGAQTAKRKWIDFEIIESWKAGMGVSAIHVHGLKDSDGRTSYKGSNPFDHLTLGQKRFSDVVKCYDPPGSQSTNIYKWISDNLNAIVEESVHIRKRH